MQLHPRPLAQKRGDAKYQDWRCSIQGDVVAMLSVHPSDDFACRRSGLVDPPSIEMDFLHQRKWKGGKVQIKTPSLIVMHHAPWTPAGSVLACWFSLLSTIASEQRWSSMRFDWNRVTKSKKDSSSSMAASPLACRRQIRTNGVSKRKSVQKWRVREEHLRRESIADSRRWDTRKSGIKEDCHLQTRAAYHA